MPYDENENRVSNSFLAVILFVVASIVVAAYWKATNIPKPQIDPEAAHTQNISTPEDLPTVWPCPAGHDCKG